MPHVMTHHMFGDEALRSLPERLITTPEERRAFLLGNLGPDPMCVRHTTTLKRGATTRHLSYDMHHAHMTKNLICMHEGVNHLSPDDQPIGRAYVLGFLGHWILDSMAHPFVFAQQNEISAADEQLAKSPTVVHAVIESNIDSWLLWILHGKTIVDYPVANTSIRNERIDRVTGALIAYTAQNVFGTTISATEFPNSMRDFDRIFRNIDPVGSLSSKLLSKAELLFFPNSRVLGYGHAIWDSPYCAEANLDHRFWSNELSGVSGTDSFLDIFYAALERYPKVAELLVRGDEEALREEIAGRNYVGAIVADV